MSKSLVDCFKDMPDPRRVEDCLHSLFDIFVISILAVICNAETWNDIEEFGNARKAWFQKFLELKNGIPSHDTFNRVFSRINTQEFQKRFIEWVASVAQVVSRDIIPIDGKTARGSKPRNKLGKALHMVSAWSHENRLVLGQQKVADKSNEITAIPELLNLLEVKNCIITIDAMGTQKEIAEKIIDAGADYVLALKENHKNLHNDVNLYFDTEVASQPKSKLKASGIYHRTIEKGHGRIETREYYKVDDIEWMSQKNDWKGLTSIGMVISSREEIGKEKTQNTRYFIMSKINGVEEFAKAVRGHWAIENELHWCLDVAFREDENQTSKDNAPESLNMFRKIALNLLKLEVSTKASLRGKRFKAAVDDKYLDIVLEAIYSSHLEKKI